MASQIFVYKNRTNIITVSLGMNVQNDTFSSQIRTEKNSTSTLLATWTVSFVTDGTDGMLKLTLDNSQLTSITRANGFMDIKRTTSGEPVPVFDDPIEVIFREVVTS
jgi:hypothetical protein